MLSKSQYRGAEVGMARKVDSELALRMSFDSVFQTFGLEPPHRTLA